MKRFLNWLFPCQHKWKDISLYRQKYSGKIPVDNSIPQEVDPIIPTHQCNKCGIALLIIEKRA